MGTYIHMRLLTSDVIPPSANVSSCSQYIPLPPRSLAYLHHCTFTLHTAPATRICYQITFNLHHSLHTIRYSKLMTFVFFLPPTHHNTTTSKRTHDFSTFFNFKKTKDPPFLLFTRPVSLFFCFNFFFMWLTLLVVKYMLHILHPRI